MTISDNVPQAPNEMEVTRASFDKHVLMLPPEPGNHMPSKVRDEITYPFPKFGNG